MRDTMEAVVVTGIGVLSSIGTGRRAYWDALKEGRCGIGYITRFDPSEFDCKFAAQLWDFDPNDFLRKAEVRRWHSDVHQAVAAAQLASDDAEFESAGYPPERIATAVGTSVGVFDEHYLQYREEYETKGWRKLSKLASSATSAHAATAHVSARFKLRGPASTIGTGCTTSLDALSWGVHQIQSGRADAAFIGATESPLTKLNFAAFSALGILSGQSEDPASSMRPFDSQGDGLVLGEAAVCFILERASSARARGAQVLGQISGYGFASEGHNAILIEKDGRALSRAIDIALRDAGLAPEDIDATHGHGVAVAMYDRGETEAYKRSFGKFAYRMPVCGTKAMTGQTYSVGGLLNAAGALMTLNEGVMPPTLNLHDPLPECDLDYVPLRSRRNDADHALVTTLSFGGTHGAAIFSRAN